MLSAGVIFASISINENTDRAYYVKEEWCTKKNKFQLTTLTGLDRSLTQSVLEGGSPSDAMPTGEAVRRRAELVTRTIQELWTAAREQDPLLHERGEAIRQAVRALVALFPQVILYIIF